MPNIENNHFSSRAKARATGKAEHALAADKDRYIEIWKKAVETQMHFNEMSVKSRQLGLTFVAAALGVAVVTLSRNEDFSQQFNFFGLTLVIHVALLLNIAAYLALWAVKELDLNVYHKMLRGAVTFGEDFEKNYLKSIFDLEKGMTQAISHNSRSMKANVDKSGEKYRYVEEEGTSAEGKDPTGSIHSLSDSCLYIRRCVFFLMTSLRGFGFQRRRPPKKKHKIFCHAIVGRNTDESSFCSLGDTALQQASNPTRAR